MKTELYTNLAMAVEYFKYGSKFDELMSVEKKKITKLKKDFRKRQERADRPFMLLGLLGVIGIITLTIPAIIGGIVFAIQEPNADKIIYLILAVLAALPIILLGVTSLFSASSGTKLDKIYNETVKPKIDAAQEVIEKIDKAQDEFINDNLHLVSFLPTEYYTLEAVTYMFIAVSNGRADSLKEAINLYEEQLHRWKLEDAACQAIEAQNYIALAMDKLNTLQEETNIHLKEIETLEYINYINKKNN